MSTELQTQLAVLQTTLNSVIDSTKNLTQTLSNHIDKDNEVRTKLALLEQSLTELKERVDDYAEILQGSNGVVTDVAILKTKDSTYTQQRDRKTNILLAIGTIVGGIVGSLLTVFVQQWISK